MTALGPPARAPRLTVRGERTLAVAIHDVEPATFERCALIRDWLDDLGVDRVTLLVIPAPQLHPFPARSPELANWLLDRVDAGDAVAQHGLQHRRTRRPVAARAAAAAVAGRRRRRVPRARRRGHDRVGRDRPQRAHERRAAAARLRRPRLRLHGRAARAPARPLRLVGDAARAARQPRARRRPRSRLGTSSALKRAASPALIRAGAALSGSVLRLDLHPADFDHTRHVLAVRARPARAPATAPRSPTTTCVEHRREAVLRANWREGVRRDGTPFAFTCPSPRRYKHQWYWDSCFHAIAWTHIDPERAKQELRTLLRAGRPDGFIPHTAFWQASPRWRRAPLYATANYRGDTGTESIQTPLLAFAWERVANGDPAFIEEGLAPLAAPRALADRASATPTATAC